MGDPVSPSPGGPVEPTGGGFTGLWLRAELPHGQVYGGRDHTGAEVTLAVLGAAAASDPRVREAFADAVWRHSVGTSSDRPTVHTADVHAPLPWAATTNPSGPAGAEQLLSGLPGFGAPEPPPGGSPPAGSPPDAPLPDAPLPDTPSLPTGAAPAAPGPAPAGSALPGLPAGGGLRPPPAAGAATAGDPARAGAGGRLPWLITAASSTMAVILLVVVAVTQFGGAGDPPAPRSEDGPRPTLSRVPDPGRSSPPPGQAPVGEVPTGEPTLRAVAPVSVIGPTFGPTENTFTMAFEGWPFAFRTPRLWECAEADRDDFPGGEVWTCDRDDTDQFANILLQECPTSCTGPEREGMIAEWLDEPQRAVEPPELPGTFYVENESDSRGFYTVDLGRFTAGPAGGGPRWLVGVYVESPPETRDQVLKILNDVISQSS